ncbi:N-alpha-acetyltransferase 30 isoform X2 [Dermochelys coriacea]|uniref:N-alpha-acetyltransferase 30 isoform X2 n=1 Tax=Dermochelys coriacea TaxID=27794 RepID=UPI001CA8892F|nr:N-alpha-acetyltransferase 30 isoform X2 [Dermochelys coriacea]
MAEVPPGPSSLLAPPGDALSPFPGGGGAAACPGALDEEEEEEGGKGGPPQQHRLLHHHHHPPRHNHQLNGLLSPELRHLRASLKSKILSSEGAEGPENKRAGKTVRSGQPPAAAPCSSPVPNHLPEPQARTAPPAATGDRSQPAAATAARNGLAGGPGLAGGDEEEEEESLLLLSTSLAAACSLKGSGTDSPPEEDLTIRYVRYESELQMPDIMRLITKDLSEPYSIYTYRYFIHNWPQLCFLVQIWLRKLFMPWLKEIVMRKVFAHDKNWKNPQTCSSLESGKLPLMSEEAIITHFCKMLSWKQRSQTSLL